MSLISQLGIQIETKANEDIKGGRTDNIGDIILRHIPFAKDESGNLFYYHDGTYHKDAEWLVKEMYKATLKLKEWVGRNVEWKANQESGVIRYITADAKLLWNRPPLHRLNFLNGIYDVSLSEITPSSAKWLSTTQIPVKYDPTATCPTWERFLTDIFPGGEDLLIQLVTWFMIPHTKMQKAVLLLGEGSNGKGTFLRMIDRIIGHKNISHMSLHQMENDRFSRGLIVGKLLNICGDLPVKEISNINFFKALVGEDIVQIEYKGKQPFSYHPYCRLIFSSNQLPKANDETEGYKRRWIVIPFTRTFDVNPKVGRELEEDLSSPTELSGLLNLCLPKIASLIETGFDINEHVAEMISNYAPLPNNVRNYFDTYIEEDTEGKIPSEIAYIHFMNHCWGIPSVEEGFTRHGYITFLKNRFPHLQIGKVLRIDGKNTKCYKGISFRKTIPIDAIG